MTKNIKKTEENNELKVQGCCRFCGQTFLMADTIGGMTEEEKNEAATCKCSCSEAKTYVRKKERKKKIETFVKEVYHVELQETIKSNIRAVENYKIDKATFKTPDGWTTTIYMDKDAFLNIKRKKTDIGRELKA